MEWEMFSKLFLDYCVAETFYLSFRVCPNGISGWAWTVFGALSEQFQIPYTLR